MDYETKAAFEAISMLDFSLAHGEVAGKIPRDARVRVVDSGCAVICEWEYADFARDLRTICIHMLTEYACDDASDSKKQG